MRGLDRASRGTGSVRMRGPAGRRRPTFAWARATAFPARHGCVREPRPKSPLSCLGRVHVGGGGRGGGGKEIVVMGRLSTIASCGVAVMRGRCLVQAYPPLELVPFDEAPDSSNGLGIRSVGVVFLCFRSSSSQKTPSLITP